MSRLWLLVSAVSISLLLSHAQAGPDKGNEAKAKADYDAVGKRMVQSVAQVGAPLKSLSKEQRAAVAALLVMSRIVGQQEAARSTFKRELSTTFWTEVSGICPAPKQIQFRRGGCMDEEMAYASAMGKCLQDKKKTESQCEREAAPELGAAVTCRMRQIEELAGIIGRIPGSKWPPGPFPWPEGGPTLTPAPKHR